MINHNEISLDQEVSAVCLESVDAGITGIHSVFHLFIQTPKGQIERTFCGVLLDRLHWIDQGVQGKIKDAKVSCSKCDKTLQKILTTKYRKRDA